MPWCPKCKLEYREGIAECTDCGSALIENEEELIEYKRLAVLEKQELSDKLEEFLKYSGIAEVQSIYNEEEECWEINVKENSLKKAQKIYEGFYLGEADNKDKNKVSEENALPADEADEQLKQEAEEYELLEKTKQLRSKPSVTYVKKEDQYKDLSSSGIMFLVFAVILLAVLALNLIGTIQILSGVFSYTIFAVICVGMLYVGISCLVKSRKVKTQIGEEETLTDALKLWMSENITKEFLNPFRDNALSDEVNYLNETEQIKKTVLKEFEDLDESYADQMIEEFYNEHFGE